MATVLYSSEDEQETPRRPQVSSKSSQTNMKISFYCYSNIQSFNFDILGNTKGSRQALILSGAFYMHADRITIILSQIKNLKLTPSHECS